MADSRDTYSVVLMEVHTHQLRAWYVISGVSVPSVVGRVVQRVRRDIGRGI